MTRTTEHNAIHAGGCSPEITWSTANTSEALPGVVTPLTWSFFGDPTERGMRQTFYDMGVLTSGETEPGATPEQRLWAPFYGRAAGNVDAFCRIADRTPGTSGSAMAEQMFGSVQPFVIDSPNRRRYPVVAGKLPVAAIRLPGRLNGTASEIRTWWQATVAAPPSDPESARRTLREALRNFAAVMRPHTLAAMLCQGLYEQLHQLAERSGNHGMEMELVTGYGDMAETEVVADLWAVSRDRLELAEFVRRHGFHGPNEGELSSRSWRMDQAPLHRLLATYQAMPDDRDPRIVESRRGDTRRAAEERLLASLLGARRPAARMLMWLAARYIPLRGIGKAAFLRCSDIARLAARTRAAQLAEVGILDSVEDAFMLTVDELLTPEPEAHLGDVVAERRGIHDEYRRYDVPESWRGTPEPTVITNGGEPTGERTVTGLAVSPGVVEGTARVIDDPACDDALEPGEVLVCRTTDPSWASTLMVAGALVIDIGGAISHGAIVARELGIPCVIGCRTATRTIRTGDRVRVDGAAGIAEILD